MQIFNEYDVVVMLIIITSSLLSLLRGFIREVFSLFAWIGAGVITFFYYPKAASFLSSYFTSKTVVFGASVFSIYLISLIVISVINAIVLDLSREVRLGAVDRTLGLAFGFVRGLIIASILHFVIVLVQGDNEPRWLTEAKTYNLTGFGAGLLKDMADDYVHGTSTSSAEIDTLTQKLTGPFTEALKNSANNSPEQREVFRRIIKGLPKQDQQNLENKLRELGNNPSESDISEVTLQVLVLYKKAAQEDMVKKENKIKEDEMPMVDEAIKGLQKKVLDSGNNSNSDLPDTDIDLPKLQK